MSDPRGELVRPFAVTRGQSAPAAEVALESVLVTTTRGVLEAAYLDPHQQLVAQLCAEPQSLAEISARLRLPLGVARVLVAGMTAAALLTLHETVSDDDTAAERMDMLQRVLAGLQRL